MKVIVESNCLNKEDISYYIRKMLAKEENISVYSQELRDLLKKIEFEVRE